MLALQRLYGRSCLGAVYAVHGHVGVAQGNQVLLQLLHIGVFIAGTQHRGANGDRGGDGAAQQHLPGVGAHAAVDGQAILLLEETHGGHNDAAVYAVDLAGVETLSLQDGLHFLDVLDLGGFLIAGAQDGAGAHIGRLVGVLLGNGVVGIQLGQRQGADRAVHLQAVGALEGLYRSNGARAIDAVDFAGVVAVVLEALLDVLVFGGVGILLVDGRLDGGAALHAVQGILANLAVDGQLVVLLERLHRGDGSGAVFAIDLAIVIAQIAQQGLHHLDGGGIIVGFIGLEGSGNGVAALEHSHGLGADLAVHSQAVIALEIAHGSGGGGVVAAVDFP